MFDPNPTDRDAALRRDLGRHRTFATGLLVVMAAVTLASYALPRSYAAELLQAAAKAGFVGGIADWFAVTALFRHPLGLPIPHTAIIPTQKKRLGAALGRFVAEHVFTEAEIGRLLEHLDLPGIVHRFLSDPVSARPAAEGLSALLPRLLRTLADGRAKRLVARVLPRIFGGAGAGRMVAQVLRHVVEGGRHQEVFGFILDRFKVMLAAKEGSLHQVIEERVREQGGRLVGWAVGAQVASRVLKQINAELERMSDDGSELRAAFDEWMRREIEQIETEPGRAAEIGAAMRRVLGHPTMLAWAGDVWGRLQAAIEADAGRPDGRSVALMQGALDNLGVLIEADPSSRAALLTAARAIVAQLLPTAQTELSGFIATVIGNWDSATVVDKLELRVGRDLQYVRVNGTLVGFVIGGVVYAVLRATFGHVDF